MKMEDQDTVESMPPTNLIEGTSRATEARMRLIQDYARLYPNEVAAILENVPVREIAQLLKRLLFLQLLAVFEHFTPQLAGEVLATLTGKLAARIVQELEPGRAAALLARLDEEARAQLLVELHPGKVKELKRLMSYPSHSVGSLMDPRVTTFRPRTTVQQALVRLRSIVPRRIYNLFLVEEDGRLVGTVPVQEVALAEPGTPLRELALTPSISIRATATQEELVEVFDPHKLASLPVVDYQGRVIGVIRHDALADAAELEASVNMQTMVGAGKEERALSPVGFAVRKRLPWLQINLVTAFLAASVVGIFEQTIARFTALAVLLPVVAGQSGNTGTQALVVTMRGLALREISTSNWIRVTLKEIAVAALNGGAVAVITSAGVYAWSSSLALSFVIGSAMVVSMAIAGVAGAAIPLIMSSVGQDPAQSSSIILTTITDVVGFFSFLGLATLFANFL